MNLLKEIPISCPYCGEIFTILVDGSVEEQQYIEDCQVCCRPMDIRLNISPDGAIRIEVFNENN